jgi:hypothetical protein
MILKLNGDENKYNSDYIRHINKTVSLVAVRITMKVSLPDE